MPRSRRQRSSSCSRARTGQCHAGGGQHVLQLRHCAQEARCTSATVHQYDAAEKDLQGRIARIARRPLGRVERTRGRITALAWSRQHLGRYAGALRHSPITRQRVGYGVAACQTLLTFRHRIFRRRGVALDPVVAAARPCRRPASLPSSRVMIEWSPLTGSPSVAISGGQLVAQSAIAHALAGNRPHRTIEEGVQRVMPFLPVSTPSLTVAGGRPHHRRACRQQHTHREDPGPQ